MTIYIVQGNCGEYSDRIDWLVLAFTEEEEAVEFKNFLELKLKEYALDRSSDSTWGNWEERKKNAKEMKKFDDQFQLDYSGTFYDIRPCELTQSGEL